jgi:hypothetical protein
MKRIERRTRLALAPYLAAAVFLPRRCSSGGRER